MGKLGKQSEALLRLEKAVSSADLDGIDAAIKECEKMGLGDEEVVQDARNSKKKIVKQNAASKELEEAIDARSREGLRAAYAAGEACDLAKRCGAGASGACAS